MSDNPEMLLIRAQEIWASRIEKSGYCKPFEKMVINEVTESRIQAEFTVTTEMANTRGGLHGGAAATVADNVSSIGLLVSGDTAGVSVNLSMSYLKGATVGDRIIVDSVIEKRGKTMAFLDIKLKKKDDGSLIATGTHVKYLS